MAAINVNIKLVDAAFNPNESCKKCLRIENANSYTFITLPDLFQTSFNKAEYKNLIDKEEIFVKEYVRQPQITYMI